MSVEEVIEQIKAMTPEELMRVREVVDGLAPLVGTGGAKGEAALERLMAGVCSGGGRHLSAGVDEALYGPGR